ncbi:hypothetical protein GCM10009543_07620 [Leifsonia naganoensis]
MWKSMFRPTITDPLASGQTTRVHIHRIRSLIPPLGESEGRALPILKALPPGPNR